MFWVEILLLSVVLGVKKIEHELSPSKPLLRSTQSLILGVPLLIFFDSINPPSSVFNLAQTVHSL